MPGAGRDSFRAGIDPIINVPLTSRQGTHHTLEKGCRFFASHRLAKAASRSAPMAMLKSNPPVKEVRETYTEKPVSKKNATLNPSERIGGALKYVSLN